MDSECARGVMSTENHDGGLFREDLEVAARDKVDALDLLAAMHEEVGRRDVQHLEFHAQRAETPCAHSEYENIRVSTSSFLKSCPDHISKSLIIRKKQERPH